MSYTPGEDWLPCTQCNGHGEVVMILETDRIYDYGAACVCCHGTGINKRDLERMIENDRYELDDDAD